MRRFLKISEKPVFLHLGRDGHQRRISGHLSHKLFRQRTVKEVYVWNDQVKVLIVIQQKNCEGTRSEKFTIIPQLELLCTEML